MEKIIVSKSYNGLTKYGYLYEYYIESNTDCKQTIINENELKDINGYSVLIRVHRIIPEPTSEGGRFCSDGIDKCFKGGLKYGGLVVNGQSRIYSTTMDGTYNFEDLFCDSIKSIKDLEFNMNPNCKIKIQIWYCVEEKYEIDSLTSININRDLLIDGVNLKKGTSVFYDDALGKENIIRWSNFDDEIYQQIIPFEDKINKNNFWIKLICLNCSK